MDKLKIYSILAWGEIFINIFVSVILYFFDKEIQVIWNGDKNILVKSLNVLSYQGYTQHLFLGSFSMIVTTYLLFKMVKAVIRGKLNRTGVVIVIQIIMLMILMLLISFLLYNPMVIALLTCIIATFIIILAHS